MFCDSARRSTRSVGAHHADVALSADWCGKRGGVRTIYYWAADDGVCYMLSLYAKNDQGDLTDRTAKMTSVAAFAP